MGKASEDLHQELLVLRAQVRDGEALSDLVQRWHGRLLAHARRLTGDQHGAEEAVQEAWVGVVKGITKLKSASMFDFWVYKIVGRECVNWVNRRRRSRRDGDDAGLADAKSEPDLSQSPGDLERMMRVLSVEHREVLTLHYMEGWDVEQIAAALEVKIGTVKSRLHYAREHVRREMGCQSHG